MPRRSLYGDDGGRSTALNFRLGALQDWPVVRLRGAPRLFLGLPGAAAREVPRDGREQPPAHARAARAARRAVRSQRPRPRREPRRAQHLAGAREPRATSISRSRCWPRSPASRRRRSATSSSATATCRAIGRCDRPRRVAGQVAAVPARKRELPDVMVEQMPTRALPKRRPRRAPLRLRRRNHRRAAGASRVSGAHLGRDHRPGGPRADLQQAADGA